MEDLQKKVFLADKRVVLLKVGGEKGIFHFNLISGS
jgi:hypothetical protein